MMLGGFVLLFLLWGAWDRIRGFVHVLLEFLPWRDIKQHPPIFMSLPFKVPWEDSGEPMNLLGIIR